MTDIDDDDFDLMSEGDRAVAEAQMRRRDKEEGEGFQNFLAWIKSSKYVRVRC